MLIFLLVVMLLQMAYVWGKADRHSGLTKNSLCVAWCISFKCTCALQPSGLTHETVKPSERKV